MLTTLGSLLLLSAAGPGPAMPPHPCITMNTKQLPLATRKSPLDSVSFTVSGAEVRVCYGRPSLRGRKMLGAAAIPFGQIWRTGANEPTMIHTTGPITLAGIKLPGGSYSLYTVPGPKEWDVIVNRSITQWGEESNYTDAVKAREVGRGKVRAESLSGPVEVFTIRPEPPSGEAQTLVLEWERTRVKLPVKGEK